MFTAAARILRIDPRFRIIALAQPPTISKPFMHAEVLGALAWHELPNLGIAEVCIIYIEFVRPSFSSITMFMC